MAAPRSLPPWSSPADCSSGTRSQSSCSSGGHAVDNNGEFGTEIVFADTAGKARALCLYDEVFEDCEWTELYVRRFKEYDKYYNGKAKVNFWLDEEHRVTLVRDFGWSCIDPVYEGCEECPAKQWCCEYERRR